MSGYSINIEEKTLENDNFREVLYTTQRSQLVVMTLQPGEEIGLETHEDHDQFIRVEEGTGEAILDGENKPTVRTKPVRPIPKSRCPTWTSTIALFAGTRLVSSWRKATAELRWSRKRPTGRETWPANSGSWKASGCRPTLTQNRWSSGISLRLKACAPWCVD